MNIGEQNRTTFPSCNLPCEQCLNSFILKLNERVETGKKPLEKMWSITVSVNIGEQSRATFPSCNLPCEQCLNSFILKLNERVETGKKPLEKLWSITKYIHICTNRVDSSDT